MDLKLSLKANVEVLWIQMRLESVGSVCVVDQNIWVIVCVVQMRSCLIGSSIRGHSNDEVMHDILRREDSIVLVINMTMNGIWGSYFPLSRVLLTKLRFSVHDLANIHSI